MRSPCKFSSLLTDVDGSRTRPVSSSHSGGDITLLLRAQNGSRPRMFPLLFVVVGVDTLLRRGLTFTFEHVARGTRDAESILYGLCGDASKLEALRCDGIHPIKLTMLSDYDDDTNVGVRWVLKTLACECASRRKGKGNILVSPLKVALRYALTHSTSFSVLQRYSSGTTLYSTRCGTVLVQHPQPTPTRAQHCWCTHTRACLIVLVLHRRTRTFSRAR